MIVVFKVRLIYRLITCVITRLSAILNWLLCKPYCNLLFCSYSFSQLLIAATFLSRLPPFLLPPFFCCPSLLLLQSTISQRRPSPFSACSLWSWEPSVSFSLLGRGVTTCSGLLGCSSPLQVRCGSVKHRVVWDSLFCVTLQLVTQCVPQRLHHAHLFCGCWILLMQLI